MKTLAIITCIILAAACEQRQPSSQSSIQELASQPSGSQTTSMASKADSMTLAGVIAAWSTSPDAISAPRDLEPVQKNTADAARWAEPETVLPASVRRMPMDAAQQQRITGRLQQLEERRAAWLAKRGTTNSPGDDPPCRLDHQDVHS